MRILHLYHDLMNLYGEYGNVVVLKKHLEDQGFEVEVDKKTLGEVINFKDYDFIYCGSGTERNLLVALEDLLKRKKELLEAINNNVVVLFTGNAMELFGERIDKQKALGVIPMKVSLTNDRYTGDVIMKNEEIGEVVGFINKCSLQEYDNSFKLFDYCFKDINVQDNNYEGYKYMNLYGTHVIGPILVKNPNFMRKIVELLGKKQDANFVYRNITYQYEEDSYNVTLNALKNRNK